MAFDLSDEELKATRKMPCNIHNFTFISDNNKEKGDKRMIDWRNQNKMPKTSKVTLGTVYDMNKSLVKQVEKIMTKEDLENKRQIFEDFINESDNQFYMLLCNDRKDYTLFNYTTDRIEFFYNELQECLINRGSIYSIDKTSDNQAIEIWLKIDDEAYCYYFFAYDTGVLEI